jgi:hypothetical protein
MNQRGERHGTTPEILLGAYIAIGSKDNQPPTGERTHGHVRIGNVRASNIQRQNAAQTK